jgi:hypothetical protein
MVPAVNSDPTKSSLKRQEDSVVAANKAAQIYKIVDFMIGNFSVLIKM